MPCRKQTLWHSVNINGDTDGVLLVIENAGLIGLLER